MSINRPRWKAGYHGNSMFNLKPWHILSCCILKNSSFLPCFLFTLFPCFVAINLFTLFPHFVAINLFTLVSSITLCWPLSEYLRLLPRPTAITNNITNIHRSTVSLGINRISSFFLKVVPEISAHIVHYTTIHFFRVILSMTNSFWQSWLAKSYKISFV